MINRGSSVPLHQQVAEELAKSIAGGVYQAGDRLPSEKQLCDKFSVSRITVRQALGRLINDDLVYSVQGIGTFVKTIRIQQQIQRIIRFSEILSEKGVTGHTSVRQFQPQPEDEHGRKKFPEGFSRMDLLGYVYNAPVVFYSSRISDDISERVHRKALELESRGEAFSSYDLYDLLGIRISRIDQKIMAIGSTPLMKEVFGSHASPAYLVLETFYYNGKGALLEWKTAYYRSDVYSFHLEREM